MTGADHISWLTPTPYRSCGVALRIKFRLGIYIYLLYVLLDVSLVRVTGRQKNSADDNDPMCTLNGVQMPWKASESFCLDCQKSIECLHISANCVMFKGGNMKSQLMSLVTENAHLFSLLFCLHCVSALETFLLRKKIDCVMIVPSLDVKLMTFKKSA